MFRGSFMALVQRRFAFRSSLPIESGWCSSKRSTWSRMSLAWLGLSTRPRGQNPFSQKNLTVSSDSMGFHCLGLTILGHHTKSDYRLEN